MRFTIVWGSDINRRERIEIMKVEETSLNEVELHVLKLLDKVAGQTNTYGITLPEGGMANTADDLIKRGFVEQLCGYFHITDAGRSQLRSNRSP